MAEKEVHAFQHLKDFHCSSSNKHFHTVEHSCSVCDFTSTNSSSAPETHYQFIISVQQFSFLPFVEIAALQNTFNNLPARAPPFVS